MNDPMQYQAVQERRFPWGCLIGGCLTVVLLMVIGVGATTYVGYSFYVAQVNNYTSPEPKELPKLDYSEDQIKAVLDRVNAFKAAVKKGEVAEPFVLTADDINALISSEAELKDKVYVTIADGKVSADASFPLGDVLPGFSGRYFNGRISLKASLESGVLIVTLDDAEVNGKKVPEEFLSKLREENLAKNAYEDRKSAEFIRRFERLTIEDDKIILYPAKNLPPEPEEDADSSTTPNSANPDAANEPIDAQAEQEPAVQAEVSEVPVDK